MRLAYYPTTRQFSNRPAAELAANLAALTYTLFAVSGSEANERSTLWRRMAPVSHWMPSGSSRAAASACLTFVFS